VFLLFLFAYYLASLVTTSADVVQSIHRLSLMEVMIQLHSLADKVCLSVCAIEINL